MHVLQFLRAFLKAHERLFHLRSHGTFVVPFHNLPLQLVDVRPEPAAVKVDAELCELALATVSERHVLL